MGATYACVEAGACLLLFHKLAVRAASWYRAKHTLWRVIAKGCSIRLYCPDTEWILVAYFLALLLEAAS
jgi:hypothetical protein